MSQGLQLIVHGVVVLALITAYTVLSVLGHDGNGVLGAFAGYLGAAGVSQSVAPPSSGSPPPSTKAKGS